ncbi:hypothetical protein Pyn_36451 [Prunus yedoensis var. nudiflora]|uniref:Uncharacterized protein n=1 Tax=Prunus yedoensis var. nudiflora TaxID=2094558 RepID=A0A314XYS7_PRUYE|nr:hypothetical protein Pyn_36451 [Prunus yedoensis var. nudiflora]
MAMPFVDCFPCYQGGPTLEEDHSTESPYTIGRVSTRGQFSSPPSKSKMLDPGVKPLLAAGRRANDGQSHVPRRTVHKDKV